MVRGGGGGGGEEWGGEGEREKDRGENSEAPPSLRVPGSAPLLVFSYSFQSD